MKRGYDQRRPFGISSGLRASLAVTLTAMIASQFLGCSSSRPFVDALAARDARQRAEDALEEYAREHVDFDEGDARRLLNELDEVAPNLRDDSLARRAELASLELRDATASPSARAEIDRLEEEIDSAMRERRYGAVDGRRQSLLMLQRALDEAGSAARRREAWMALGDAWNDIAPLVRRLIDERTVLARSIGYPGGEGERSLALAETEPLLVEDVLVEIQQALASERGLGGDFADADGRRPWSVPVREVVPLEAIVLPLDQDEVLPAIERLLLGMGFDAVAVDEVLAADAMRIDAERFVQAGGLFGCLSRVGRELYERYLPFEPSEFARPASDILDGAVGRLFGSFAHDEGWLRGEFEHLLDDFEALDVGNAGILQLGHLAARVDFEREAYRNPGRDLDELWWNVAEKWTGTRRSVGIAAWARDRSLVTQSFRARDELLARVVAAQLRSYLIVAHGGLIGRPQTAEFLCDRVFARGASAPWPQIVEDALATPTTAAFLLRDVLEGATRESIEAWLNREGKRARARNESQLRRTERRRDRDRDRDRDRESEDPENASTDPDASQSPDPTD